MDLGRRLRGLLIAVAMGAGQMWACMAQAAGHSDSHAGVQVVHGRSLATSQSSLPSAVPDCHPVATDAQAAHDDGGLCSLRHCVQCAALPASSAPATGEPPLLDTMAAEATYRPGRCTAPETPPPIA